MGVQLQRFYGNTESVCPVCLKRVEAEKTGRGGAVFLEKTCPEHGHFRTMIWGGHLPYEDWARPKPPAVPVNPAAAAQKGCPYDCGLCPEHRQRSCCVLLEVTARCSLGCPVCYASAGAAADDPELAVLLSELKDMLKRGGPFNIQLSGGEPTMRDDLPELIRAGKEMGYPFFQLNTNGLRLAQEPGYAETLARAGLDCVFLQFDGVTDAVFSKIRGRPLLAVKKAAISACAGAGLGIVLVPTLYPGVNTGQIGEIIAFAAENLPHVRGVHFQPVSYFGRYPEPPPEERFTLSHLLWEIEQQTAGGMKMAHFSPGGAENAYCSFSGNFIIGRDSKFTPLSVGQSCCCGSPVENDARAERARAFVAQAWKGPVGGPQARSGATASLDDFLDKLQYHSLAVSAMAFMDAWTLDLDRLRECYIHVAQGERLIPFCAWNLTSADGQALYRL